MLPPAFSVLRWPVEWHVRRESTSDSCTLGLVQAGESCAPMWLVRWRMPAEQDGNAFRVRVDAAATGAAVERAEAAAPRAESQQAVRHGNILLETAASIVARIMARRGLALAQPVAARFQSDARGSTGIDLSIKLVDPADAGAAAAALHEDFGAQLGGVDLIRIT